jgi:hypothetical protein
MPKIHVWAELSDEHYGAYEREASRRGVPVEDLVEQTVNCLLRDLEKEDEEAGGELIFPC